LNECPVQDSIRVLAQSENLSHLKVLRINRSINYVGDVLSSLAESPYLKGLEEIDLTGGVHFSKDDLVSFLKAFPNLKRFYVDGSSNSQDIKELKSEFPDIQILYG
jgi:hypothetical protein